MIKLKSKKIIGGLLLIVVLMTTFQNMIYAVSMNQRILIDNYGKCDYTLQYKKANGIWSYVTCTLVGYSENGKVYPAYCLNKGVDGVGEVDAYNVDLTQLIDDYRLWRVAINGYPYKTPSEMGVENEYDAYLATKQAIYSILYNTDVESYYRGGNARGVKVYNAIKNMVNEGRNGTYTPQDANVTINKVGELKEESNYYSQEYTVSSRVTMSTYTISDTINMPSGAYISDLNGNEKTIFDGGNNFKVMILKSSMGKDINITMNISSKCKTYPVFFGKTTVEGTQNYLITADSYGDFIGSTNLQIKGNTAILKIKKVDQETKETLKGVTFEVKGEDGKVIGTYTTNSSGEIIVKDLYPQTVTITEILTRDEYVLNSTPVKINLEWNKTSSITLENMHKKGNLKIYKVDLDDNKLPVSDVEFEITDQDGYKYTAISDENGIAYIENIRTGIATIKELKTNDIYKLSNETYNVEINENETTEITITNEKLKGQIEVYKVDSEDKEIKLEGVEFQVINSNNEVVETIVTNSEGYAITSRIPIGEYILKETKTDNMHILNEEIIKVDVTTDIISKIEITNKRIKGQIKVIKTSLDDNFINEKAAGSPIKNVKFEIYDSNNNLVDEITTSSDGTAITKLLDKGCYFIKEVESGEWYLLNENTFNAEIKEHQEIVKVEITNESEKP